MLFRRTFRGRGVLRLEQSLREWRNARLRTRLDLTAHGTRHTAHGPRRFNVLGTVISLIAVQCAGDPARVIRRTPIYDGSGVSRADRSLFT